MNPVRWIARRNRRQVLVICPSSAAVGGVTRVALSLGKHLQSHGRDVVLLFPEAFATDPTFKVWAQAAEARVVTSPAILTEDRVRGWRDAWRLWRALRKHRQGVVSIHYGGSRILLKDVLPIWLSGRRCVATCHAPTSPMLPSHARKLRLAALFVDEITVVSYDIVDILVAAGVKPAKITVIHGGVEPPTESMDRAKARRALGLPAGAFVVGTVARLSPEKAVDRLVAAVEEMPPSGPEVHLLVKGDDGPELERVLAAGRRLGGRFHLLDMRANNSEVYAAMDVYGLSSTREGYPLVLMEAAFHGVPTVSTDVGSISRLVDEARTGFIVREGDISSMAKRLEQLRQDPCLAHAIGASARAKAERSFSAEVMARKFERVFFTAASRNARST